MVAVSLSVGSVVARGAAASSREASQDLATPTGLGRKRDCVPRRRLPGQVFQFVIRIFSNLNEALRY